MLILIMLWIKPNQTKNLINIDEKSQQQRATTLVKKKRELKEVGKNNYTTHAIHVNCIIIFWCLSQVSGHTRLLNSEMDFSKIDSFTNYSTNTALISEQRGIQAGLLLIMGN